MSVLTAQNDPDCLEITITPMVTPVLGDPCSFEVNFELEPMEEPGNNIIEKAVVSFYIEENGSNALLDITSTTVSSTLQALNFQTSFYQLTSELNAVFGSIMNVPIFDGDDPIVIEVDGPGLCETVTMSFEYFSTDVGWCYYEEQVEICTPVYEEPETTVVCSQTTDVNDCPATVPLVGTPFITGVCNPDPYFTSVSPDGSFCIQVPVGGCVELEVENCDDLCEDELTGADVVQLRRIILGIINGLPANPYAQVLADVNCDGQVSTLDLVLIQRYILGFPPTDNDCQPGDCIVFDPGSVAYDDNGDLIPSSVNTTFCDGDDISSFVMGKMGDINGNCSCEVFDLDGNGGNGATDLFVSDNAVLLDQTTIYDLALELVFNRPVTDDDFEFVLGGADVRPHDNTLLVAYSSDDGPINTESDYLELLRFLSNDLVLESVDEKSFAVSVDFVLLDILLVNRLEERSANKQETTEVTMYMQGPYLVVDGLDFETAATVDIYDLSGRVVLSTVTESSESRQALYLDLPSGLYISSLRTTDNIISDKIRVQ